MFVLLYISLRVLTWFLVVFWIVKLYHNLFLPIEMQEACCWFCKRSGWKLAKLSYQQVNCSITMEGLQFVWYIWCTVY